MKKVIFVGLLLSWIVNQGVAQTTDYSFYFTRGQERMMFGDYHGAVEDLSIAIRQSPDLVEAYTYRSQAYLALRAYELARQDQEMKFRMIPVTQTVSCPDPTTLTLVTVPLHKAFRFFYH